MITRNGSISQWSGLRQRFFSLPTLLSFGVALAFIYFLTTRFDLDWRQAWDNVRSMKPELYAVGFSLYYFSFLFRGLRWQVLARSSGISGAADTTLPSVWSFAQLIVIGWFVNGVTWLRLGDAYRAYVLSEESKAGFSWSLGTVLAERAVDMLTVITLLAIGGALFYVTQQSTGAGYIIGAAFVMSLALATLLVAMSGYGNRLARLMPSRLESAYHGFQRGTLGSLSKKTLPLVSALGFAGWMLEVGRLYFVVQALGLTISFPLLLIVALGHAILSTVPTPGGVGAVEPGVTGLLVLSLSRADAVSITLVDRTITYVSVIVLGGLVFLLWQANHGRPERRSGEGIVAGEGVSDD